MDKNHFKIVVVVFFCLALFSLGVSFYFNYKTLQYLEEGNAQIAVEREKQLQIMKESLSEKR